MKISARNKLHGMITDVTKGATTAHVRIDLGGGAVITCLDHQRSGRRIEAQEGREGLRGHQGDRCDVGLD